MFTSDRFAFAFYHLFILTIHSSTPFTDVRLHFQHPSDTFPSNTDKHATLAPNSLPHVNLPTLLRVWLYLPSRPIPWSACGPMLYNPKELLYVPLPPPRRQLLLFTGILTRTGFPASNDGSGHFTCDPSINQPLCCNADVSECAGP